MLTATSLSSLFPRPSAAVDLRERYEIETRIKHALGRADKNPHKVSWTITDGGEVDMQGREVNLNIFLANGELPFKFNHVSAGVIRLDNAVTLRNTPTIARGNIDIRSPYLTTLSGGPQNADTYFVAAENLTDLEGCPTMSNRFIVHSLNLQSFAGLEHVNLSCADFKQCPKVTTTTGLSGACFGVELELPTCIDEITDLPAYCASFTFSPRSRCAGFSRLFSVPGLIVCGSNASGSEVYRAYPALNAVLKEVTEPRKRQLAAEQVLIDMDLEAYI